MATLTRCFTATEISDMLAKAGLSNDKKLLMTNEQLSLLLLTVAEVIYEDCERQLKEMDAISH